MIQIREADIWDSYEMAIVYRKALDKENVWMDYTEDSILKDMLSNPNSKFFIAINEFNEIIGGAGVSESFMSNSVFEFCFLGVLPKYQHQGIGISLINARVKWMKSQKERRSLYAITGTRVPDLFRKMGWETHSDTAGLGCQTQKLLAWESWTTTPAPGGGSLPRASAPGRG